MKKSASAAALFPSLLLATSVIFASGDGTARQLSDVSDGVKAIMQDQKDPPVKPPPGGVTPVRPSDGIEPVRPLPKPPGGGQVNPPGGGNNNGGHNNGGNNGGHNPGGNTGTNNPPAGPSQADIARARSAGQREGAERGAREGRREGYSDGVDAGEREGRRRGTDEGDTAGRNAGRRDGWNVDQAEGMRHGNAEGQNAGISNGTAAGKRRCFDEGYTRGYNEAYAAARQQGLQDAASYNAGFAQGQADASVAEVQNGQKAGYQAGFSQREAELERSFPDMGGVRAVMQKGLSAEMGITLEQARGGYTTPEERRAYEEGYKEGYRNAYRRAYDDARRDGYYEKYNNAYRWAYDVQYSISYRSGYAEGKEQGYREAYSTAYDSAYNHYYSEYNGREYADQRSQGLSDGRAKGNREGFEAGSAEQTKRGYSEGYAKKAAEVYPAAFEAGKQAGIAAANRFYAENSVLKLSGIAFYDGNGNGSFEAGENIMLRAEVRNYGFQRSETVTIAVKSERGEVLLAADLRTDAVAGRGQAEINLPVGRLSDIVAPGSDALYAAFTEKGRLVGELRQPYFRVNNNKVGIVVKDKAKVREKSQWLFSKKLAELQRGEKVIITGQDGSWYKVRRSEIGQGGWTEGYIKARRLSVQ